jgi:hypothetical protein
MALTWRRLSVLGVGCLLMLAGCGAFSRDGKDEAPPWTDDASTEIITAAPDAGGPLSFRNCPTLEEAMAAMPGLVAGPDANAVPFKTMVLQCGYDIDELDVQGRPAGVGILVFDASAEGVHLWDSVRTDPGFPNATEIPGLAEVAFATGTSGFDDIWVVQGDYGFHILHTRQGEFPGDEMVALARAMLTALERPPR